MSHRNTEKHRTIRDALMEAVSRLAEAGVETPWLDAWVLLADILGIDRGRLIASYPDPIPVPAERRLQRRIEERLRGSPVSYLIGRKEFYGLTFRVDRRVLVPRPDTEVLVDAVLTTASADPSIRRVHDCCAGSGCIAIALAHERRDFTVSYSDISTDALSLAQENARSLLGRELPAFESDLLSSVPGVFDVITANPPYLTTAELEAMQSGGRPEPRVALDGGDDGLDAYRRLIPGAVDSLCEGGYLFVEAADKQIEAVRSLFMDSGYRDTQVARDLGDLRRVCWGRR